VKELRYGFVIGSSGNRRGTAAGACSSIASVKWPGRYGAMRVPRPARTATFPLAQRQALGGTGFDPQWHPFFVRPQDPPSIDAVERVINMCRGQSQLIFTKGPVSFCGKSRHKYI
jgi:hypothetical protein